jgi:hypothetical protein
MAVISPAFGNGIGKFRAYVCASHGEFGNIGADQKSCIPSYPEILYRYWNQRIMQNPISQSAILSISPASRGAVR